MSTLVTSYTKQSFDFLKNEIETNILYIDDTYGYIDMTWPVNQLNLLTENPLKLLIKNEKIKNHIASLVGCWRDLKPDVYMAFMVVDGWKKAFLEYMSDRKISKQDFIGGVIRGGMWEEESPEWKRFPEKFGLHDWIKFSSS